MKRIKVKRVNDYRVLWILRHRIKKKKIHNDLIDPSQSFYCCFNSYSCNEKIEVFIKEATDAIKKQKIVYEKVEIHLPCNCKILVYEHGQEQSLVDWEVIDSGGICDEENPKNCKYPCEFCKKDKNACYSCEVYNESTNNAQGLEESCENPCENCGEDEFYPACKEYCGLI